MGYAVGCRATKKGEKTMSTNNWEFHFRNMNSDHSNKVEFRVNHAGCAGVPWDDGRPRCWSKNIEYNPDGGHDSVYCPSDWVVKIDDWLGLIKDGLTLVKDLAIFAVSEGTDEEALINALGDIFAITKDSVQAALDKSDVDINTLMKNAQAGFENTCKNAGVSPDKIRSLASHISSTNWAFIAGQTYHDYIKESSEITGKHGWSVFSKDHDKTHAANHAFVYNGHLYYIFEDETLSKLWK